MKYKNPIIPGFSPDPSICRKGEDYYLVNSSFEYFPAVPIFHSRDLVNWEQIGHCLTRKSQLNLSGCRCSGGIAAPTIRYHEGYFYMITTCVMENGKKLDLKNFYVKTKEPDGEWSDPVYIDISGIDPSIYWEDDRTYVQYATFENSDGFIVQVEIELETGKILHGPIEISKGFGGRDVEAPHLFQHDDWYYLLTAEGGTREGHMVAMGRGKSLWGPFEANPYNPVISNRNKGRETIQSVGHADIVEDEKGTVWMVALGTRPVKHKTLLGRETMLSTANWTEDGWLKSRYGYMPAGDELPGDLEGEQQQYRTIELNNDMTELPLPFASPRFLDLERICFEEDSIAIQGNRYTLDDKKDMTFYCLRQNSFNFKATALFGFQPKKQEDEAGIALLMDEGHHMELVITMRNEEKVLLLRKKVADLTVEKVIPMKKNGVTIFIDGTKSKYFFGMEDEAEEKVVGWTWTKHLATENSFSPFTGVMCGLYVTGDSKMYLEKFKYQPQP